MTKHKESNKIYFGKLSFGQKLSLALVLILSIYLIWIAIQPLRAEFVYRKGFNRNMQAASMVTAYRNQKVPLTHPNLTTQFKFTIEDLEKTVALAPWETHYMIELAKALESFAKIQPTAKTKIYWYKRAEAVYKTAIQLDEINPWHRNRLATIYLELKNIETERADTYQQLAKENIKTAAHNDPQNPLFQLNYAYFLHQNGELDAAIPYYEKVMVMDDRMHEAFYNLADVYRQKGMLNKTLDTYLKLAKVNPDFANVNLAIASTYILLQDAPNAISHLEKAISKNPKQLEALKTLGSLYMQTQEWLKAAITFEQLINAFPEEKDQRQYLIQAMAAAGYLTPALKAISDFQADEPNNPIYKEFEKKIQAILKQTK